jgi:hypothetical protein
MVRTARAGEDNAHAYLALFIAADSCWCVLALASATCLVVTLEENSYAESDNVAPNTKRIERRLVYVATVASVYSTAP